MLNKRRKTQQNFIGTKSNFNMFLLGYSYENCGTRNDRLNVIAHSNQKFEYSRW